MRIIMRVFKIKFHLEFNELILYYFECLFGIEHLFSDKERNSY